MTMISPPHIMVTLIHIHGGLKGEIQEFHDPVITVGRLSTCSVKFPADEPGVSREHARIEREGNQFKLVDLSKYGTYVNGRQAKEAFLKSGDVLEFGPGGPKASITMEIGAAAPQVAPVQPQPRVQPQFAPQAPPAPAVHARPEVAAPIPAPPVYQPAPPAFPHSPAAHPGFAATQPAPPGFPAAQAPPSSFIPVQKSMAPLVIQFGPTIRSYRELPVTLGAGGGADFVIRHPGILDQHAQIFFHQGGYWIKDLTGQAMVRVNLRPAEGGVLLNPNDEIVCGLQGPTFRFLGEGRLAEVEAPPEDPGGPKGLPEQRMADTAVKQDSGNLFSRFVKGFKN